MKQKTMNYLMFGAAAVGIFFLIRDHAPSVSGVVMRQRPRHKHRHRHRLSNAAGQGGGIGCEGGMVCGQGGAYSPIMQTSVCTFGDCGSCGGFCCSYY